MIDKRNPYGASPFGILFVCTEYPWPPNHGGRVDTYNRLSGMLNAGCRVSMLTWGDTGCRDSDPLAGRLDRIWSLKRRRLAAISGVLSFPFAAAQRRLTAAELNEIATACGESGVSLIWLDGIWGGVSALQLSERLELPYVVRSHNIEHKYMPAQFSLRPRGLRSSLHRYLHLANLEQFERNVLRGAERVYDISADDVEFWRADGYKNVELLPPTSRFAERASLVRVSIKYDAAYIGNLHTPNNIDGLSWFFREVVPRLIALAPDFRICIAGAKPSQLVIELCESWAGNVDLIRDPEEASDILGSAKVLFNPVFVGSGVNIKTLEMLGYPVPVIGTEKAVQGLPSEIKALVSVANDPSRFVDLLQRPVLGEENYGKRRSLLEKWFGEKPLLSVLADLMDSSADLGPRKFRTSKGSVRL